MRAAWDDLPQPLKAEINNLLVEHSIYWSRSKIGMTMDDFSEETKAARQPVQHPLVRTHPETGRKALYVNVAHTSGIVGMTEAESTPILNFLFQHQVKPEFTCRFVWQPHSLAVWDNRCTQHNPINDYHGFRRVMHRITLAGDQPI